MADEENDDNYRLYKILLLGDSSVGKSCLLLRYCEDSFQESHLTTIGLDFRLKKITLDDNRKIKVQIWDTAGEDRFRAITKNYYRGANGILLLYDVTDQGSFDRIREWIDIIKEETSEGIIIYLVANKIDLKNKRIITNADGKKISEEYKISYFETSAKASIGVNEVFESLVKEMDDYYLTSHKEQIETIHLNKKEKNKKRCCK